MDVFKCHGRFVRGATLALCGAGAALLAGCQQHVASHGGATPDIATTASDSAPAAKTAAPKRRTASSPPHGIPKSVSYSAVGTASWYGPGFHGRRTANGETFDMNSLTAAHPTLPLHAAVRVTNLANQRSLVLRVNDRGPYTGNRLIDVSAKSAQLLGFYDRGLAKVKVDYIGRADAAAAPRRTASAAPTP